MARMASSEPRSPVVAAHGLQVAVDHILHACQQQQQQHETAAALLTLPGRLVHGILHFDAFSALHVAQDNRAASSQPNANR